MDAQGNLVQGGDPLPQPANEGPKFLRDRVPYRIRDIDRGRAFLDDRLDDAAQVIEVGAGGVLGGLFHIRAEPLGMADRLNGGFQRGVAVHAKLLRHVDIR